MGFRHRFNWALGMDAASVDDAWVELGIEWMQPFFFLPSLHPPWDAVRAGVLLPLHDLVDKIELAYFVSHKRRGPKLIRRLRTAGLAPGKLANAYITTS